MPAGGGDDILTGGMGDDALVGGAGQDLLVGGFADGFRCGSAPEASDGTRDALEAAIAGDAIASQEVGRGGGEAERTSVRGGGGRAV
jgi:hypothetical protein